MLKVGFAIALLLTSSIPAVAQPSPYSEVLDGNAQLFRNGSLFNISRGARIYEGDSLTISSHLRIILPYGAATVTKRQGTMKFLLTRREGCGIRVYATYRGGIGAVARSRTCLTSSIIFESLASGAYFNPWVNTRKSELIPNTRIAQALPPLADAQGTPESSGAAFTLTDRNETSILAVSSGAVEAQNENVIVPILGGQGNITPKGQPPGGAIALDNSLSLNPNPSITPIGFRLNASLNPLNFLFYQGVEIAPSQEIEWPILGNSLNFEVRSADGLRSRPYVFPLPERR
jgi:hypothetical protein